VRVVVMSSGGVDSSVTMLLLKRDGHEVFPMHVNYGHFAEDREWSSCQRVCDYLSVNKPVKIDVKGLEVIPSSLVKEGLDIEKDAFLPTRNLLFVVLGSAYAFSIKCNVVALGILAQPIFPDQKAEFFQSAETCISLALGRLVKVLTPLIELDKRETLKLAKELGMPLNITYYCHAGTENPCGRCISCKERIAAEEYLLKESS
jgi:7-cyano-7-deazaguanine synthase